VIKKYLQRVNLFVISSFTPSKRFLIGNPLTLQNLWIGF